jgi:acetyl esterase/lipase
MRPSEEARAAGEPGAASLACKAAAAALFAMNFKAATLRRMRAGKSFAPRLMTRPNPPAWMAKRFEIRPSLIEGRAVFAVSPRGPEAGRRSRSEAPGEPAESPLVFFLHGGAFSVTFSPQHWRFVAWLSSAARATVIAPDYPLSPEAGWRETLSMARSAYKEALAEAGGREVAVIGDSAGGCLALALAQSLRQDGLPRPSRLILISPWLDVSVGNPEIRAVEPLDPVLSAESLRLAGLRYAGGDDPADPRVSPLFGDLRNLPPIALFTGTADILNPDARRLRDVMRAHGSPLDYLEYTGMIHDWLFFSFPEAARAKREILSAGSWQE